MAKDQKPQSGDFLSQLVTQWERSFDAFANQLMSTEGFSEAMNQAQSSQLGFQKLVADAMGRQLSAMNMPTREDLLRLGEAIQQIDRRLERIEELLARGEAAGGAAAAKSPPRTRKPPQELQK